MALPNDAKSRRFTASSYPTPVARLGLRGVAELWIKNDGVINSRYGGNKVRKLERILPAALASGARRIVTLGAAGSHHVLATTLFAGELGLPVCAALFPQPWSEHAERTLSCSLAHGLTPLVSRSLAHALLRARRARREGDYYVPAGGANVLGTEGFMHAVRELAEQIAAGELPEPDVIVAPLGTGGTVAGLLAGVVRHGLASRVVGVEVTRAYGLTRPLVLHLARRASGARLGLLAAKLDVETGHAGRGYGHATERSSAAQRIAAEAGLTLDATYTAKAFAKALELAGQAAPRRVLYWHTLSAIHPELPAAPAIGLQGLETLFVR